MMAGSFDRPLPDSSYRKAPAPRMGNAYGAWAGREDIAFDLPGANVLQFDLSRLDLSDYRAMRDHYQINANNMVLMFMLHQQDWKIECDSEKVAKRVEENLRRIWTRLIRASSTALWAGYAPCALEWDNVNSGIEITKIKDLPPEECRVNWKTIEGYAPPGTAKPKFYEFDGINQRASTAAIPPSHSFWYPMLMEHGNHYGRKLLRAAFIPWFYSQLIHLFSNRYFERFGEPLPIGRADFEAEVITSDGTTTDGRTAMNSILTSLRNRSVVTLPSDRDPDTKEFTFDIEYLESQMRGADFERYLLRLDEEISLAQFTPLLVMRAGGTGGYNQGVQHTQTFLWMLNALSGDMKEYIDRYIVDRIVNYNFGENAPRAYWVPRKLGKDNVETMRSVVTELVRSGAAKVDLDELGTAIGLTLEEVELIQEDPAQPEMPATSTTETDANGDVVRIDTRTGRQRPGASGPRGVGQTRTTARNISARVRTQIEAQFRKGAFGRTDAPKMGYRRGFTDALIEDGCSEEVAADLTESVYRSMNTWMAEAVPFGREVFDTADEFVGAFERLLDAKIDALVE